MSTLGMGQIIMSRIAKDSAERLLFFNGIVVAAFRNDNSERIARKEQAEQFFQGAPSEVLQVANQETLQFLLDEVDGTIRPFITAAFWG